jgi:hypothetical protein
MQDFDKYIRSDVSNGDSQRMQNNPNLHWLVGLCESMESLNCLVESTVGLKNVVMIGSIVCIYRNAKNRSRMDVFDECFSELRLSESSSVGEL